VRGWKQLAFADPEATIPRKISGATVLSPFDPVVWRRDRAERLWNFEYRIEIYVPASTRQWGYYVLPVMVDGDLVARVDVKNDRNSSVLRIKAAHSEAGKCTEEVVGRVADALRDLASLVEASTIEVEQQGDLARVLSTVV
jgi:uncharacterized protein YcaQ